VIIHAHLLDGTAEHEREALGILGVDLDPRGVLRARTRPADRVVDEVSRDRVEIDIVKFSGRLFTEVDNRLMSLQLVERGLTDAAMFATSGEVVHPSDVLYKRPILIARGSFRPATNLTVDMLHQALGLFRSPR